MGIPARKSRQRLVSYERVSTARQKPSGLTVGIMALVAQAERWRF